LHSKYILQKEQLNTSKPLYLRVEKQFPNLIKLDEVYIRLINTSAAPVSQVKDDSFVADANQQANEAVRSTA
jgi:hypothetical protein